MRTLYMLSDVPYNKSMATELNMALVGERLKVLRLTKGLSLRQLAAKCGVSHAHIAEIENGVIKGAGLDKIRSICAALGVTVNEVIEGTGLTIEESGEGYDAINPTLRDIQVDILAMGEMNAQELEELRPLVRAMREKAQRSYEEELRVRRADKRRGNATRHPDTEL